MFKVIIQPLLETCDNLKMSGRRLELEAETLKSVESALSGLSYLDEQRRDIRKKLEELEEKRVQLNQMEQALSAIADCYGRTEERIAEEYEQPKIPFLSAEFDVNRFRDLAVSLKRMEVI